MLLNSSLFFVSSDKFYQMSSFGESKFMALGDSEGNSFVKHNTKFLSRTYPGGIRVDSSNYNPQDAWNLGCQIGEIFIHKTSLGP